MLPASNVIDLASSRKSCYKAALRNILNVTSTSLFVNALTAKGSKISKMLGHSRISLLVIPLCVSFSAAMAAAQWHEPFESPTATWRLAESDAAARLVTQRRTIDRARMGSMSEYLRLRTGLGSYAYLSHEVPGAVVIQELQPRVSVYAHRSGIQFLGIIVLPHAIDPVTNRPISTIVHGTSYKQPGVWQELTISNIPQQLARQVRRLRNQKQMQIDTRGAHLSHVVLNAYTEPGVSELWIDQLIINGFVSSTSVTSISNTTQNTLPREERQQATKVQLEAETLRVNDQPFFPIMIEHQGEPFAWLKAMGINCVKLARSPSASELQAAEANDLWIVAPPPHFDDRTVPIGYDRVLSWSLGNQLGMPELQETEALAAETKRHDKILRRPLICGCHSSLWRFSSAADVLLLEPLPLFSEINLPRAAEKLRSQMRHMRAGKPAWAYIATQPNPALVAQLQAIAPSSSTPPVIDADQIRLATYYAVASGCRGICFQSQSRLDLNDAPSRARAQTIRQINLELDVIRPWLATSKSHELLTTNHDNLQARVLKTKQAELVMLLQTRPAEQFVLQPTDRKAISLKLPTVAAEAQLYRIRPAGLRTLARTEDTVEIDHLDRVTLVLATQDPHVVHYVSHRISAHAGSIVELRHALLLDKLRRTMHYAHQVPRSQTPRNSSDLVAAKSQLMRMARALTDRDLRGATEFAERADTSLTRFQSSAWRAAVSNFTSPAASPACVTFDTLPFHSQLQTRLQHVNWSANLLPAGDLENWETMRHSGWQFATQQTGVQSVARIAKGRGRSGGHALELSAKQTDLVGHGRPADAPPVRVDTPPLPLPLGSVVQIQGWVRTNGPIRGHDAALIIYDSLAGPALGVQIDQADDWQPFTLYRIVTDARPMTLSCVLAGHGTVWLDNCRITTARLADIPQAQTANSNPRLPR